MIDIRDYDLALVERIKTYYQNTHWVNRISLPIKEIRDRKLLNGQDVEFPIITVRRTNCPIFSKEYNSWSRSRTGDPYLTGNSSYKANHLQNIDPELANSIVLSGHNDAVTVVNSTFELTYYIDVISFERDNFDTLMVELQENLNRVPYVGFYNLKSDGTQDKMIKEQACHLFVEDVEGDTKKVFSVVPPPGFGNDEASVDYLMDYTYYEADGTPTCNFSISAAGETTFTPQQIISSFGEFNDQKGITHSPTEEASINSVNWAHMTLEEEEGKSIYCVTVQNGKAYYLIYSIPSTNNTCASYIEQAMQGITLK